ncbi:carbon-nitrogen hydrolase family protein [Actinomadura sp. NPDC048955]|uniref:carbon-nitrogen hydrolase family protein n=1 Tax=Actinomadura sp. NPDC048955 TaxID=3158228 RepID=UPI0033BFE4D9
MSTARGTSPHLGADRFVQPSSDRSTPVFDTSVGRIGLAICYEIRFPEVIRCLALAGAQIVLLPTNWPEEGRILADHFTRVRAAENFVHLLASNRPDWERGTRFIGASSITGPYGTPVRRADSEEAVLLADITPSQALEKSIVVEPGEFEIHPWRDRRPLDYRPLGEERLKTGTPETPLTRRAKDVPDRSRR